MPYIIHYYGVYIVNTYVALWWLHWVWTLLPFQLPIQFHPPFVRVIGYCNWGEECWALGRLQDYARLLFSID